MKNLIIQYYIDINLYPGIKKDSPSWLQIQPTSTEKYSKYSFEKYCQKYGHDFLRVTEPALLYRHPTWERFDLFFNSKWVDQYDQILYVDTDVFALDHAPDIFQHGLGLESFKSPRYSKYRNMDNKNLKKAMHEIFDDVNLQKIRQIFFQSGVFMINKHCRDVMMPWVQKWKDFDCDDGQFLAWCVAKSNVDYQDLNPQFNVKNNGLHRSWNYKRTWFLHSAGGRKYKSNSPLYDFLRKTFPNVNQDV